MRKGPVSVAESKRSESRSTVLPASQHLSADLQPSNTSELPMIQVSEGDGTFNVCADFSAIQNVGRVTVEFAEQGIVITGGEIERYVPIPTDAEIEWATVSIDGPIARISVPTAGLGQRRRAITMW